MSSNSRFSGSSMIFTFNQHGTSPRPPPPGDLQSAQPAIEARPRTALNGVQRTAWGALIALTQISNSQCVNRKAVFVCVCLVGNQGIGKSGPIGWFVTVWRLPIVTPDSGAQSSKENPRSGTVYHAICLLCTVPFPTLQELPFCRIAAQKMRPPEVAYS